DDAPDSATGTMVSYFPSLQELDLSSNEITGCSSLPVVQLFPRLKCIRLSDNPCTRGPTASAQRLAGISIVVEEVKPFYMKGNGCFAKSTKNSQPKLKLDRTKLRRVGS
ncbi:unnamed protein product, partial [Polarella glacialis]